MKTTFLLLTTIFVSLWLCARSERTLLSLQRHRRSISESTRSHNEYQRSDRNVKNIEAPPSTPSTPSCVPGARWRNDCNSCWCLATGATACTLLRCPKFTVINREDGTRTVSRNSIQGHGDKHSRVRRTTANGGRRAQSSTPCTKGDVWMNKCNSCRCLNGRAACTRMRCRDDQ